MTVQKTYIKNIYKGNGIQKVWPITFDWNKKNLECIKVYVRKNGTLSQATDFKLEEVDSTNGYQVIYPTNGDPLAELDKIIITREIPFEQGLLLENKGPFFAKNVEVTFDEVVMMCQQIREQTFRSLKVPVDIDAEIDMETTIPVPEDDNIYSLVVTKSGFSLFSNPGDAAEYAAEARSLVEEAAEIQEEFIVEASAFSTAIEQNALAAQEASSAAQEASSAAAASAEEAANKTLGLVRSINGELPDPQGNVAVTTLPAGAVITIAGTTIPEGYLLCNGCAVSRTTYAALFAAIGTTYGEGDGSTTFTLPNLVGRFIEGGTTSGAVKEAGLPNITGSLESYENRLSNALGVFTLTGSAGNTTWHTNGGASAIKYINFNASKSNEIYGASETVQPPAVVMQYIIKY